MTVRLLVTKTEAGQLHDVSAQTVETSHETMQVDVGKPSCGLC